MIIYTDGACSKNPGPGGFGVVVLDDDENLILTYSEKSNNTTNNREELKAILWAFLKYGEPAAAGNPPVVCSDSAYCVNTFTSWMFSWEQKGWKKSDNTKPENLDLIIPFFNYWQQGYRIDLQKVRGHANNKWNNLADKLATGTYSK
jgi:ribonuclease HI